MLLKSEVYVKRAGDVKHRLRKVETFWGYLFILPALLIIAGFHLLPAAASFVISLTDWNGLTSLAWTGLSNYVQLLRDEDFIQGCIHTLIFTIFAVPISTVIALGLAVLLNGQLLGKTLYRTAIFVPVVTMTVAVGIIWRWLYHSEYGPINTILRFMHLPEPNWLTDAKFVLPSIIIVSIWSTIGTQMILLLAGLQGIGKHYYEAAEIDGAGLLYQFKHITLPLLSSTLFFVIITALIGAFQLFDLVLVMTNGNSLMVNAGRSIVYTIYEQGFVLFNMGYASAQAVIYFLFILLMTILQFKLQSKWVHY